MTFISPALARSLLAILKARALVLFEDDSKFAHSPFPYDKKFFKKLRPDQVPRFLRCVSDPQKLPTCVISMNDLYALQNRVNVNKVESIRTSAPALDYAVVVRIRPEGRWTIADGLHRLTAEWLDDRHEITVRFADLSEKTDSVEPVPGAGQFDRSEERAREYWP